MEIRTTQTFNNGCDLYNEVRKNEELLIRILREGNLYKYIDENIKEGEIYLYKLIGYYNDGSSKILNEIKVKIKALPVYDFKILSFLSGPVLFLKISLPEKKQIKIGVINVLGQKVFEKYVNLNPGSFLLPFSLPDIRGLYFLKIQCGEKDEVIKTIKILK